MTLSFFRLALILSALSGFYACKSDSPDSVENPKKLPDKVNIQTVNYPLFYFAERISAGESAFTVSFEAPADVDPAYWEPSDDVVGRMQQADLIFMNGATYAKWIDKVSLPTNTRINTSNSFRQMLIVEKGKYTHSHGNGVVHSHDGISFTTWLDFRNARNQAVAVRDALVRIRPDKKDQLESNTESLLTEIDALDKSMIGLGNKLKQVSLLGSHPVYQYLARRYQLSIRSVHWEPETIPDEKALAELSEKQQDYDAKVMIWEGQPIAESRKILSDQSIKSIVFDPCANRPESGDWLSVMKQNIANLESLTQ